MKTTMMFRTIANPRRTTLAHLKDVEEMRAESPQVEEAQEHAVELPRRTANPRRTVLAKLSSE